MPVDQIEPIQSDWDQMRSAPGIHIAGSSYGMYRVAVNESYVPWLTSNGFKFQHVDPAKPVNEEESVQGNSRRRGMLIPAISKLLSAQSLLDAPKDLCWLIGITPLCDKNYLLSGQFCGATW